MSRLEANGAIYTVSLIGWGGRRDVAAAKAFIRKAMKNHQRHRRSHWMATLRPIARS
jgi:hypothetical protein